MNPQDYVVRFYPRCDILKYPWVYHDRAVEIPNRGIIHTRTGSMDWQGFEDLKADIDKHGVACPFIIEYYDKHLPNAKGLQGFESLAIRTGNNRAEAMYQLGKTRAPALFVVPRYVAGELPLDYHEDFPIDKDLQNRVSRLWQLVCRGERVLGVADAWKDSVLLVDIIREAKGV